MIGIELPDLLPNMRFTSRKISFNLTQFDGLKANQERMITTGAP